MFTPGPEDRPAWCPPAVQGQVGAGSAGSLLHRQGVKAPICPTLGIALCSSGVMHAASVLGGPQSPSHYVLCFSCEELQDIDLELNVDNSAFYDQFAIAQVGGAARQVRSQAGRGTCPALQETIVDSGDHIS